MNRRGKTALRVQSSHKIEYGKVNGFVGISEAKILDLFGVLGIVMDTDTEADYWASKEDFEAALEDLRNPEKLSIYVRTCIQQSLKHIGMTWEQAREIMEAYWAECEPEEEGMFFSFIHV